MSSGQTQKNSTQELLKQHWEALGTMHFAGAEPTIMWNTKGKTMQPRGETGKKVEENTEIKRKREHPKLIQCNMSI